MFKHHPQQNNLDRTYRGIKKVFNFSLILPKNKTNPKKIQIFQSLPDNITYAKLTHTPTEHPSTNVHGNQQNIYDINIQRRKLYKGMLIANTLKVRLNSQLTTTTWWLVTTIKEILKTPIQKFEKPILLFRRTHEAEVRNSKILAETKR